MNKILILLVCMLLSSIGAFSVEKNDYYVIDSITYTGVRLVDYGSSDNCLFCHELVNGELKTFTPNQVKEYGIGGKLHYIAMDVFLNYGMKRVFLLKQEYGVFDLYQYMGKRQKWLFLQKRGGPLVELHEMGNPDENFRHQLELTTLDNPSVSVSNKQVEYSLKSIGGFLEKYQGFKTKLSTRWGVSLGMSYSMLSPPVVYFNLDLPISMNQFHAAPTIGLFLEQEVFRPGLFVHAACNATLTATSYNQLNGNLDNDFIATIHTLEWPIQLKYVFPLNHFKPFIEAGGIFSWNFYNENYVNQSLIDGNVVEMIGINSQGFVDVFYIGPSLAFGLEYPLKCSKSLFAEFRFERSYGVTRANQCELSKIVFSTGFVF